VFDDSSPELKNKRRVNLFERILNHPSKRGLGGSLALGSLGTFAIRGGGMAMAFLSTLLLTHGLGAQDYGLYAWAYAWVSVLSLVGVLGFDRLFIARLTHYLAKDEIGRLRGLLRRGHQVVALTSLALIGIAGIFGIWALHPHEQQMWVFLASLPLVTIFALNIVRQAALQALGKVVLSRIPDDLLKPALFIVALLAAEVIFGNGMTPLLAMALQVLAATAALAWGGWWLRKVAPAKLNHEVNVMETRIWVKSALPLWYIGGISVLLTQADIVLVGILRGSRAAGIYAVASRIGALVGLVEFAINAVLQPTVARLHAAGEHKELQVGITRITRSGLLLTTVFGCVGIALAGPLLSIFGPEFVDATRTLQILCVSFIVSAVAGQNGVILMMTGLAGEAARGTTVAVLVNVGLNCVLIPIYGFTGAAWTWLVTVVVWNAILSWRVYACLGINATAFGSGSRTLDA
jgi:O-antigen/teichoic acid export membrane protein